MAEVQKPGSIVHVELITKDTAGAKKFFGSLFGWKFQDIPQMGYSIWAAPSGPGGGMMAPSPEQPGTGQPLNYIYVDSIDKIVPRIESAGGKMVVSKTAIPGFGWSAFFQYPENMIWGLYESTPRPAAPKKKAATRKKRRGKKR